MAPADRPDATYNLVSGYQRSLLAGKLAHAYRRANIGISGSRMRNGSGTGVGDGHHQKPVRDGSVLNHYDGSERENIRLCRSNLVAAVVLGHVKR